VTTCHGQGPSSFSDSSVRARMDSLRGEQRDRLVGRIAFEDERSTGRRDECRVTNVRRFDWRQFKRRW
jgi:hypothetical protein